MFTYPQVSRWRATAEPRPEGGAALPRSPRIYIYTYSYASARVLLSVFLSLFVSSTWFANRQ